ncbi:MAG: GH3 auxin-responsive promoter family protein [Muribaculaceae bacterium]
MNFTPIARTFFSRRLEQIQRFVDYSEAVQREQLTYLLESACNTQYGQRYGFGKLQGYNDFCQAAPLASYQDLKPYIMRMVQGERNVLWPGRTVNFAQSSGTSDGKSKYIPITRESFARNHYKGSSDVVALYLNMNPDSRLFAGKAFILGGSFANEVKDAPRGTAIGDLSANLIENINPVANLFRVPGKQVALMADWEQKLPALVAASLNQNITNISGVPSWFLTVLREVIKARGANTIHDVWPNLEVFFHGGISFDPYREQYRAITNVQKMHYVETYNASEGFFATQSSTDTNAMLLLLDVGVFYEFIPLCETDSENPTTLPMWQLQQGGTYEIVISSCNGLWRYRIGDTVTVESTSPLKIRIAGRTRSFINAFGEELMVHNATDAITRACQATGAQIADYTAAPVYTTQGSKGHHQWLVEFTNMPDSLATFTEVLDRRLKEVNSDYEAKRNKDIFLAPPVVTVARHGLFDQWLALTGKRGGQRKVPRLSNNRQLIDQLLELNKD